MKIIVTVGIVTLVLGGLMFFPQSTQIVNEKIQIIEKEIEKEPWMLDEDAVKAAQDVIKKKELEAELSSLKAVQASTTEKIKALEKELGTYWRDVENLRQEVRAKAEEYGVSAVSMSSIIGCESGWDYTIQSKHTYHEKNVPKGYQVGDTEQSYGLVQIHLPAHPSIKKEDAINPEFAIDFLAKNLKEGKANMWTCAKQLAIR